MFNPQYSVYMIHSNLNLSVIKSIISNYGPYKYLRKLYNSDGTETNRIIGILNDITYRKMRADGLCARKNDKDVTISPFIIAENHFPGDGRTWSFFIPVPEIITELIFSKIIEEHLTGLANLGIIPVDSWSINIPQKTNKSGCFVCFKKYVSHESIAMVRILLDGIAWPSYITNLPAMRCFWAYDKTTKETQFVLSPQVNIKLREDLMMKRNLIKSSGDLIKSPDII